MGGNLSTSVRAFLTRRRDPLATASYAVLIALVVVVVVAAALMVSAQVNSL